MNVEGSKEVLIKTYEYDPQILYLCQKKNITKLRSYNHVKALWNRNINIIAHTE